MKLSGDIALLCKTLKTLGANRVSNLTVQDLFSGIFFTPQFLSSLLDGTLTFAGGVLTLIIGLLIAGRLGRLVRSSLNRISRIDRTLIPVASSIIRYAIIIVTIIIMLGQFGVQTTSIIAILGAAGLAIGLALQGTLSNVAAGVMLLILRPFESGDWIETNGISGTVKEIGLFTTHIDTFDNVYISVPNSTIWSSTIINHAKHTKRRLDLTIGIGYDSDFDVVETAMQTLMDDPRIHKDPAPVFHVVSYDDSAITVRMRLYADYTDLFQLGWDLNRRLKPALDAHNIDIPFPQRVVHYAKNAE